jgi:chromosomal replication initiation ATPase DnaA
MPMTERSAPAAEQLAMRLSNPKQYSSYYFVPHSGVSEALAALSEALDQWTAHQSGCHAAFLLAGSGLGKTHLLSMLRERAEQRRSDPRRLVLFDDPLSRPEVDEDAVARSFIDAYERLRREGGVLVFAARECPSNPHILSRLAAAVPLTLGFPQEHELRPLILSLAERRNLRLSEKNIEYLLDRLPAHPLSLSAILARIDELSLARGKQAGRDILRTALDQMERDRAHGEDRLHRVVDDKGRN